MKNYMLIICLVLFGYLNVNAQTLLTCSGSKTGAKVSFVSRSGQDIKIKVDWKEGSHFYAGNLVFTNATCTDCQGLGGQKADSRIWTIRQQDVSKQVSVAWAPPSTSKYCGGGTAVTIPEAPALLECSGSKTGAKVSFVSKSGQDIKIKVDWKEGSHFYASNLVFTNATCTDCQGLGGQKGDSKIWTIRQQDASKPVSVAWASPTASKYCGGSEAVTIPQTGALPIGSSIVLRGNNTRLISILGNNIKGLAVNQNDIKNAEVFQVIDAGNGKVALLASNNKYVTHDNSIYGRVGATADTIGDNEKFTIENLPSGGFSIKASNGKFIQAGYSSGGVLVANSTSAQKFMHEAK